MGENYFKSGTVVCLNKLLIFKIWITKLVQNHCIKFEIYTLPLPCDCSCLNISPFPYLYSSLE